MGRGSEAEGSKTEKVFSGALRFQQRQEAHIYTSSIWLRNTIASSEKSDNSTPHGGLKLAD